MVINEQIVKDETAAVVASSQISNSNDESKEIVVPGKRKTQQQMKDLINYYHLYEGHWDEKNFASLIQKTGFNKK